MKLTAIGAVILLVLSFVLINAGARGTYRSAWAALTQPAKATPTSNASNGSEAIQR